MKGDDLPLTNRERKYMKVLEQRIAPAKSDLSFARTHTEFACTWGPCSCWSREMCSAPAPSPRSSALLFAVSSGSSCSDPRSNEKIAAFASSALAESLL